MRTENISFRKLINAGASGEFRERIKEDGILKKLVATFYTGQQLSLQVVPLVEFKAKVDKPILTYAAGTDEYLAGDNETVTIECDMPVSYDDEIIIRYRNIAAFTCHLCVDVVISYTDLRRA